MDSAQLREIQAPLKADYTSHPERGIAVLDAHGVIRPGQLSCGVETAASADGIIDSGLHPKAGGDGNLACSGDMLLQALVACSGVTFAAIATAMDLSIHAAAVLARGEMDFRGTLGVNQDVPVGLTKLELEFRIVTEEPDGRIDKLIELTERYCVVLQSLTQGVDVVSRWVADRE